MTMDFGSAVSRPSCSPSPGSVRGYVSELFCSIQGEGPCAGERHIFLRTAGCSGTCRWCDTVYSKTRTAVAKIHGHSDRMVRELQNPMDACSTAREILALADQCPDVHTVSITGGEPLEQPAFVAEAAKRLREEDFAVYLETNGIHESAFADVLPFVDVVAMDIKLPSATGRATWKEHSAFLSRIRNTGFDPAATAGPGEFGRRKNGKRIFVKVVVDGESRKDEVESAAVLVASVNPSIPMVLQPERAYYARLESNAVDAGEIDGALNVLLVAAAQILDDVRVLPQVHKIFNVR